MFGSRFTISQKVPGWRVAIVLAATLLLALPGSLIAAQPVLAQAEEPAISLTLGEYVGRDLAADEIARYTVYFPEDGIYMVSPEDAKAAESLKLTITNEAGEVVYEGGLSGSEQAYQQGLHTLQVATDSKAALSFFVLGRIGQMSDSDRRPGKLGPGSVYQERNVSTSRYAELTLPTTRYPQEVLLYLEGGEGDSFSMYVDGEDAWSSMNTDNTSLLRFWSGGGDYLIEVHPYERRSSFTLIVFLSGPPPILSTDAEEDGYFEEDATTVVYALEVKDVHEEMTVVVTPETKDSGISMEVVDRYSGGNYSVWSQEETDGALVAEMTSVLPGIYYVVIDRTDIEKGEQDFKIETFGKLGRPLEKLTLGEPRADTIADENEVHFYQIDGVARGMVLKVSLTSEVDDHDLDLGVGVAQPVDQWTSTSVGSSETVLLIAPTSGAFYVQVYSYSGEGDYTVTAELLAEAPMLKPGELVRDTVDENGRVLFGFEVTQPGLLLSVLLLSDSSTDLDLSVTAFNEYGDRITDLYSSSLSASEIVSQADPDPGIYEVRIDNFGEASEFALQLRLEDPLQLLGGEVTREAERSFADDFSDSASGWAELDSGADGSVGYKDQAYQMVVPQGRYSWAMSPEEPYTDAVLEVEAAVDTELASGYVSLICRKNDEGYVYLHVAPSGSYSMGLTKDKGETTVELVPWTDSDDMLGEPGAINLLRLECVGKTIAGYVNDTSLASVEVDEASAGSVGLGAGSDVAATEGLTARFDNFSVREP
jgi:hypothetical protein